VDPRLLDHFSAGETIDHRRPDSAEAELRALLYREGDVVSIGTPAEIPAAIPARKST
jgi:DNA topoisomerase-1